MGANCTKSPHELYSERAYHDLIPGKWLSVESQTEYQISQAAIINENIRCSFLWGPGSNTGCGCWSNNVLLDTVLGLAGGILVISFLRERRWSRGSERGWQFPRTITVMGVVYSKGNFEGICSLLIVPIVESRHGL